MADAGPDTDELLARTAAGDAAARGPAAGPAPRPAAGGWSPSGSTARLAARVDPSDVVQEALAEADRRLDDYLRDRPLPFYPWLRRLAAGRLATLHRRHVRPASGASPARSRPGLPDESALELADRLLARDTGPRRRGSVRSERRQRVRAALDRPGRRPTARCWCCGTWSSCPTAETAAVLGVGEGAVKMRLLRALQRLRGLLGDMEGDES